MWDPFINTYCRLSVNEYIPQPGQNVPIQRLRIRFSTRSPTQALEPGHLVDEMPTTSW